MIVVNFIVAVAPFLSVAEPFWWLLEDVTLATPAAAPCMRVYTPPCVGEAVASAPLCVQPLNSSCARESACAAALLAGGGGGGGDTCASSALACASSVLALLHVFTVVVPLEVAASALGGVLLVLWCADLYCRTRAHARSLYPTSLPIMFVLLCLVVVYTVQQGSSGVLSLPQGNVCEWDGERPVVERFLSNLVAPIGLSGVALFGMLAVCVADWSLAHTSPPHTGAQELV